MTTSPEGLSILSRLRHIRVFNEGLHKPYFYMNMQSIIHSKAIHSSLGNLGKFDYSSFENKEIQCYSGTIFNSITEILNKVSVFKLPRI